MNFSWETIVVAVIVTVALIWGAGVAWRSMRQAAALSRGKPNPASEMACDPESKPMAASGCDTCPGACCGGAPKPSELTDKAK